jgi:hypothetical protein
MAALGGRFYNSLVTIKPDDIQLIEALDGLPNLRKTLGDGWIIRQQEVDPLTSEFPLARWLRLGGKEWPGLTTFDDVLGSLARIKGIEQRHRALKRDGPGFFETLMELYFAAWLTDRGYTFDLPVTGPDFDVHLGSGGVLRMEVTTPRQDVFFDELFQKMMILTRRVGYRVYFEFVKGFETDLDRNLNATSVKKILSDSVKLFGPAASPGNVGADEIVQEYPDLNLRLTWTRNDNAGVKSWTGFQSSSHLHVIRHINDAAYDKTPQFPNDEAGALVVGTLQLRNNEVQHFLDGLTMYKEPKSSFDRLELPERIKYVVVYRMSLSKREPLWAIAWVNEKNPRPDPPGFADFWHDLFPDPLRQDT